MKRSKPSRVADTKRRASLTIALILLSVALWIAVLRGSGLTSPARRHLDAGMEYAKVGQSARAEQEWLTATRLDRDNADAWELLAQYYTSTNNCAAAMEPLRQMLRLRPQTPGLLDRLAACAFSSGDEVSALNYTRQELARTPDDLAALKRGAVLLGYQGDNAQRLDCLRRLARLQPNSPDDLRNLASALIDDAHYTEALPFTQSLLGADPNDGEAHTLRGICLLNTVSGLQGAARAQTDFETTLRLNPNAPFAHLYLGEVYRRRGEFSLAIQQIETAARLLPYRRQVYHELSRVCWQARMPVQATRAQQRSDELRHEEDRFTALEDRCAANPTDFDSHLEAGLFALRRADRRKAGYYLHHAALLKPDDLRVHQALQQLVAP
jgi:Flp pilus assembly protein TadD